MTRKSKREIERAVDDLDGGDGDAAPELSVVYGDTATDTYYADKEMTERVAPDDCPGKTVAINGRGVVVMRREKAEQAGRKILGAAEDIPADGAVRVRAEGFAHLPDPRGDQ